MNTTMKNYLRWAIANFGVLALLLFGNEGLYDLGIILLWVTAVIGCLFLSPELTDKVVAESYKVGKGNISSVNKYINYAYDIAMTIFIAYLGHPVLAAFYAIHIAGLVNIYKAQEEAFVNKLKGNKEDNGEITA